MTAVPEQLGTLLRERRVVPFVGAGFSAVAGFPNWFGLLRAVYDSVVRNDPGDFEALTASCAHDPLRVAEYLLIRSGGNIGPIRYALSQALRTPEPFVSSAHIDLANLGAPTIYTTNFDDLIESTFDLLGHSAATCCNARDLAMASTGQSQIVKFHGDLRYDETLVLTESSFHDRLDFESPLDLKFRGDILGRSLLFIGYGFGDVNIRVIWSKLSKLMATVPLDDRPPSFIVRLTHDRVVEALDRAVGLTTITLDPGGLATSEEASQRLLQEFMVDLTFFADESTPVAVQRARVCSPMLLERATDVVSTARREAEQHQDLFLEAVRTRDLRDFVRPELDGLLAAFAKRRPRGQFAEYYKAIAFNLAMSEGASDDKEHG